MTKPYDEPSFVAGAKSALNYRGFDDYMVYYTLLSMGISKTYIEHIGREEREIILNKAQIKSNSE